MDKQHKIGLFGFGCVGQGLYDILEKTDFKAEIVKICVKNREKKRSLPAEYFTFDSSDILEDESINLVVELIDNADEAYEIVTKALRSGKNVVTANKKMVAEHLAELLDLQKQYGASLLYEGAVCGSIPIIRTLEEYYDNELLYAVSGIFNGSSNYILTKVIQENLSYQTALKQAQDLGFAETDPTLDVGGFDPLYKLCLVALHAYGVVVKPTEIFNYGIQGLSPHDIQFALEKGYKLKLLANVQRISEDEVSLSVMPHFVGKDHYLYHVENEYNAAIVEAAFSSKQVFTGKGAGGHPTGSAVLSDISANRYGYKYEYRKAYAQDSTIAKPFKVSQQQVQEIYLRYHEEADFELFDFINISEKYQGTNFNYVIGTVRLENLCQLKETLVTRDIFIANTGKIVETVEKAKEAAAALA